MDVITQNLFCLLRSGALDEHEPLEPMSPFKWRRLCQIVQMQDVGDFAAEGLRRHADDPMLNIPDELKDIPQPEEETALPSLSNSLLNKRLNHIREDERHQIDTNVAALDLLDIIVGNVSRMLNTSATLKGLLRLGSFLRQRGDRVDFVKFEQWITQLHIRRMAQLQGSMLISVFGFEPDELPFVERMEGAAGRLVMRSVANADYDTAEEWHFRQGKAGFVTNNSKLMRRNLRRSFRLLVYAPIETISNFFGNFTRSLQEIEE